MVLIAGLLLSMNGLLGLAGWQWLYLVEGSPAVVLGVVVLFYLTERPEQAHWLNAEERDWLSGRIRAEQELAEKRHRVSLRQAFFHPTVWHLTFIMFVCQTGSYGLTLWVPQIIKSFSGLSDLDGGRRYGDPVRRGSHRHGAHRLEFRSHRRALLAHRPALRARGARVHRRAPI